MSQKKPMPTETTTTTPSSGRLSLRRERVRALGLRTGVKTGTGACIDSGCDATGIPQSGCRYNRSIVNTN